VTSVIGWTQLRASSLWFLGFLELALLGGLTGLALVSFWHARATTRKHHLPLPAAVPSLTIGLFIFLGLAVTLRGVAASGVSIESRYVTIYLPWCFVLLVGWALRIGSQDTGRLWTANASRAAHLACLLWLLCQVAVTALNFSSQEESYIAAGSRSPVIAWVKMNVAPNETILTNRGPDLAFWSPNPILALPRPPFSAKGSAASWDAVDRLASKAHARYMVHFLGHPATPKWGDVENFRFLRSLDRPENFPERNPISFTDGIVYQVGGGNSHPPNFTSAQKVEP